MAGMIKKITIQDFFSFKGENTIELNEGINLLLGINGSGKTSFLNALKLLYEGVSGIGIERLFQEQWGGYNQVANANGNKKVPYIQLIYVFDPSILRRMNPSSPFDDDVNYSISISPLGTTSYTIREKLYSNKKGSKDTFTYLDFKNGTGKLSVRETGSVKFENYKDGDVSGQELVLKQITDPSRYLPSHTIRKAIESMSIYAYFDTGNDSKLRFPTEFSSSMKLRKNGDNLSQLLNNLKNKKTLVYNKIEENLSKVNPTYKSIEFTNFSSQLYLSLREKNLDKTIGALHISDGTLRFLLLMCIFYNPERGFLIGLDEPESGLHPDMIKSVGDMMKCAAADSQMILATHSPLLLNQFELEDVLIFEKDEENKTIVKRLSESDFPDWEGDFLPGQMWLRGQIGAKRW
jgi:predicted ATPase